MMKISVIEYCNINKIKYFFFCVCTNEKETK